jgi:hypothetical protein
MQLPVDVPYGGSCFPGVLGAKKNLARPELEMFSAAGAGRRLVGEIDGTGALAVRADDDAIFGGRHTIQQ